MQNSGGGETIGMSTAAYGSPLCVCRVFFKDGGDAILHRYLDFEMGWVFSEEMRLAGTASG